MNGEKDPYSFGKITNNQGRAMGNLYVHQPGIELTSQVLTYCNVNDNTPLMTITTDIKAKAQDIKFKLEGRLRGQMGMGGWDYQKYNVLFDPRDVMKAAEKQSGRLVLQALNAHNEVLAFPVFEVQLVD